MAQNEKLKCVEVNGVTLHYAEEGNGKPVILVHGNGEDHHLFDTEIRQLVRAGYKVYAPDSRGHGANAPLTEYHYIDMAEDMYQFIRVLGLDKPVFYGHSDGGIIGLLLEITHPGTLSALAVSGANLSPAGLSPSFIEEFTERNKRKKDPLITLMLTEPQIRPEDLRGISVPVLVTAGENDLILRTETEKIGDAIPDARVVIVPGEDHGSYIAGSEIMGQLLIDFLDKKRQDLFERLARSKFRSRFVLRDADRKYIQEKGLPLIRTHASDLIRKRLAPAVIPNDGKQTPMRGAPKGHPVFIGQHATATCCRGCLEKWHGIPKGRALTEEEQAYITDVLMQWIYRQI